ncbi:hypothetical protein KC660_04295, partial [Candidatus Dojkabacteria bacterium]|nr:hypothetical protein [Candidatus Dojkabacteria bacterium]
MNFTDYTKFKAEFEALIKHYNKFVITAHSSPDPDCVSSCLLMKEVMSKVYNIDSRIILRDRVKKMYSDILVDTSKISCGDPFASVDSETILILLDAN